MSINYVTGDATEPIGEGQKIVVHVCNDIGGWGRGFVVALSKRWAEPEKCYRAWHRGEVSEIPFELGEVQFVAVGADLWVANLIGQRDVRHIHGIPPVRYDAIRKGLRRVSVEARTLAASVHMPRIGCGLAGGEWGEVGRIVEQELANQGIPVTVYDLGL
jgi:O-acetyl-ADP-ribose deacetylase (regulator of RNase III)